MIEPRKMRSRVFPGGPSLSFERPVLLLPRIVHAPSIGSEPAIDTPTHPRRQPAGRGPGTFPLPPGAHRATLRPCDRDDRHVISDSLSDREETRTMPRSRDGAHGAGVSRRRATPARVSASASAPGLDLFRHHGPGLTGQGPCRKGEPSPGHDLRRNRRMPRRTPDAEGRGSPSRRRADPDSGAVRRRSTRPSTTGPTMTA